MVRLFPDDCVIYRIIKSLEDQVHCASKEILILFLTGLELKWQMQLNIDKYVVLRCTRSLFPVTLDYKSVDITLKVVKQYLQELLFMKACSGRILYVIKQANP